MSKAKAELPSTIAQVRVSKGRYSGLDLRVTLPHVVCSNGHNLEDTMTKLKLLLGALDQFCVVREK